MMILINKCILFAVVLQLFLLFGCQSPVVETDGEIKDTVRLYNALLAEGYRELNMNALKQVSTEQRVLKAYYHMAAFGEGQVKMDARLNKIKFLSVTKVSQERVDVQTEENWHYIYNSIVTGDKQYENDVSYLLTYRLVKVFDRWLVDDIIIEQSEGEKGEGELPFMVRPTSPPDGISTRGAKVNGNQ